MIKPIKASRTGKENLDWTKFLSINGLVQLLFIISICREQAIYIFLTFICMVFDNSIMGSKMTPACVIFIKGVINHHFLAVPRWLDWPAMSIFCGLKTQTRMRLWWKETSPSFSFSKKALLNGTPSPPRFEDPIASNAWWGPHDIRCLFTHHRLVFISPTERGVGLPKENAVLDVNTVRKQIDVSGSDSLRLNEAVWHKK